MHPTLTPRWVAALTLAMGLAACASTSGPSGDEDLADPVDGDLGVKGDLAGRDLASGDMASSGATCNPATKTLGAAGGPDTCAYGEVCDAGAMKCVAVATGSCNMIMGAPTWNKAAKMAPVITKATAVLLPQGSTNGTTECLNMDAAALVTVDFYAPNDLTTTSVTNDFLMQVKFKKSVVAGDPFFSGTFLRSPIPSGKSGSFQVGINCGGAAGAVKTAGFYILDESSRASNAVCVSW